MVARALLSVTLHIIACIVVSLSVTTTLNRNVLWVQNIPQLPLKLLLW